MDIVVDKLIETINKKNIKVVTISEPNHRSYTSHTFNFELMKCVLRRTDINTFSSEKLGVFDAMMIEWHLRQKKPLPENIHKIHEWSGLGTKRWLDYFKKCRSDRYRLVGGEFNPFHPHHYEMKAINELFSPKFVKTFFESSGEIVTATENDKLALASFQCMEDFYGNREKFWQMNIKRILEEHDNLFIVGFHLDKGEPIGKMIKKMYPSQSLFIGSCSINIRTQLLIVGDENNSPDKFNHALETRNYKEYVDDIEDWAPPTSFERKLAKKASDQCFYLYKVPASVKGEKIRGIGCFIAMTESEYRDKKKMKQDIFTPIKRFDYIVYMRDSRYEEVMFL